MIHPTPNTAESIAEAIVATVDACLRSETTLEQCSIQNLALWGKAVELGVQDQVSEILQKHSLVEMAEAVKRSLLDS